MGINKNSIGRLENILNKIDDPHIREIVKKVIDVEITYRSENRMNFPWNKVRNIINDIALKKELDKDTIE